MLSFQTLVPICCYKSFGNNDWGISIKFKLIKYLRQRGNHAVEYPG